MIEHVLALMLHLAGSRAPLHLAPIFLDEASRSGLPVDVMVAVAWNESAFEVSAVSRDGKDRGLFQIRSTGVGAHLCRRLMPRILEPRNNIRCAARIMARVRSRCGGPPARWLSAYNGRPCGPSSYSRRVLRWLAPR